MKKQLVLLILVLWQFSALAQSAGDKAVFTTYYHDNGKVSSEGYLLDGKPNGFWKTYYPNGNLKSAGNRKNFELDSLWQFFDDSGKLSLEINYRAGRKQGYRVSHLSNETIREYFDNDIKQQLTTHYDTSGSLLLSVPFVNGLEEGLARRYATDGRVIELMTYKKGFLTEREKINHYDADSLKHGLWKSFYDDGVLQSEVLYKHGLKHGFAKEYDRNGNLKNIEKYVDGVRQEGAEELSRLELRRDYYPDGKIKVEATYRNGVAEGVRREFGEDGSIEKAYILKNGKLFAEGIMSENGQKQDAWIEYYPDGKVKARGNYLNDKKTGNWEFYYPGGQIEQQGAYDKNGQLTGKWIWFYSSGQRQREESYRNGLADGLSTEFEANGKIITQGEYLEGMEEGYWLYDYGDYREEGDYQRGLRTGLWKDFYPNGKLAFEGKFIEDNPNGEHRWYWPNGLKKEEGQYIMGRKNGEWKKFREDGSLFLLINYTNGIERKYDGIPIPENEQVNPD
ncbi:MAG: toxin-antitoxin system YwqK family antitoxin [Bacteroidales bacterium]|nr:toxin-antitoxin system YwqK family antitoxin [Bacteroidales bacterium]